MPVLAKVHIECTARAPDAMALPVATEFEMRPKRSHFERPETRMLFTMASVESGTTRVPASCLGLLWFHWYDGCKRRQIAPNAGSGVLPDGFNGRSNSRRCEKRVESPAVDCAGDATGA